MPLLETASAQSPTSIAIAVVEYAHQFLIGQRPPSATLALLWEFPGGKVLPGETAAAAAVRECLEETGLAVVVQGEYPPHEESYAHGRVALRFFACTPLNSHQPPQPPFRWVPRAQLAQYEFPAGNSDLLAELLSGAPRPEPRISASPP